jgi:hypothetical protein
MGLGLVPNLNLNHGRPLARLVLRRIASRLMPAWIRMILMKKIQLLRAMLRTKYSFAEVEVERVQKFFRKGISTSLVRADNR